MWWIDSLSDKSDIEELVINLDNGPNSSGTRTQFIKRMVAFSDTYGVKIRLLYYPPYHSKYNPIERCWGRLEEHWNGETLHSVNTVLRWAKTMTWKGINPSVYYHEKIYEKGIKLNKEEMKPYENRIIRAPSLPKWHIIIEPLCG